MSIKKDYKPPPPKPLRSVLKEAHKNEKEQHIAIDPNQPNQLNKMIHDKIINQLKPAQNPENQRQHKKRVPNLKNTGNNHQDPDETWRCSKCTFANLCIMAYCEMCGTKKLDQDHAKENQIDTDEVIRDGTNQSMDVDDADARLKHTLDTDDAAFAKQLQKQLEQEQRPNAPQHVHQSSNDELMAQRLQFEYEKEMLALEKEKIANERAAMALHALEQQENAHYFQYKKEQEERMKEDEEFAMKLQKEQEMDEKKVTELFQASLKKTRHIVSIENISGNDKHEIYEKIMSEKIKNGGIREEIERYLWHGTKSLNNLKLIMKNGFDRSYNTTSQYGKGTYFARDASYSAKGYCGQDSDGIFYILLCKVIVGDYTVGNSNVKAIPMKPDQTEYDSLVNSMQDPAIFVVWRDYHATPVYLVKFR